MVEIKEVKSKKDIKEFINFPLRLYKGNPYFVPPLYADEKALFKKETVYSEQAESVFYIAKKDGKWGVLTVNEETYKAALAKSEKEKESEDIFNYVVSTAGSTLNIRSQPSVDSEKLGEIPNGAKIAVSQIENGWAYMTYGEYTGYVSANFIKPLTETPVTENTTAAPGNID